MTAQLNTLIDRGRELRANEEAQQAEHERQAQLAKEEEVRLWLTRLAQDLGISAEDFQALSPQFDPYQYGKGGEIELHWRGQKVTVNCEAITRIGEGKNYQFKWSGLAQGDLKEHLAEWLFNAEETYTERKRDALADLTKLEKTEEANYFPNYARHQRSIVWLDPDVIDARVDYLKDTCPGLESADYGVGQWLSLSLDGLTDEGLNRMVEATRKMLEARRKREKLLERIRDRRDPMTGEKLGWEEYDDNYGTRGQSPVSDEEVDAYWNAARAAGLDNDDDVIAARRVWTELQATQRQEAEFKVRRDEAEQEGFYPFMIYYIEYSYRADDGEGGLVTETDHLSSLRRDPDTDGYYHTLGGRRYAPANLVGIERVVIQTLEQLRALPWSGSHKRETPYGRIYAPPEGAERIQLSVDSSQSAEVSSQAGSDK